MTEQTEPDPVREAFDRWFTRNDLSPEMAARAIRRDGAGRYLLMQAHTAWETWEAAYAQARADLIAELRPVASAQITPGCGGLNIEATFSGHLYLCDDPRIATGGAPLAIIPEK
ncbi:hypothetical protein V8Z80_08200 [Orrella sp. JC864]|uniref:hypothetical protein n=1 Tax=Orrella sp. JC864 TaxID=3120298 RepID=UPI0030083EEA